MSVKEKGLATKSTLFSNLKWQHLVAGVSGGVASTLVVHPLDLVKIRFQVNEGAVSTVSRPKYSGMFDALASVYRTGGTRALYQGIKPNILGAGSSWGLYFLFYNTYKTYMQGGDTTQQLPWFSHLIGASACGVLTLSMTNPIWIAKTRMCLEYSADTTHAKAQYNGIYDCLRQLYIKEGIRGLYRGYVPGLLGTSHGALQFMSYDELKNRYNIYKKRSVDHRLGSHEYLVFAAISKSFASALTFPYQVVRSRLQDQHRSYEGVVDCVVQTWRNEGILGFYKGLVPNLLRVTPACCITFVVYENIISYLMPTK